MSMRHFLYGGLIGLIAGLLLAPKSGKETRQDLTKIKKISKETYESVANFVVAGYEEAKLIKTREAAQIRGELRLGYDRIRTVFETPAKDRRTAIDGSGPQAQTESF